MFKFTGRPPKFQDPEELEKKVADYFIQCDKNDEPYTVTGLAYTLGITVKQLRNYADCVDDINILKQLEPHEKRALSTIVKRAYLMCEMYAEKKMLDPKCTKTPVGYLFALKNYKGDFVDRVEQVVEDKTINVELVDLDELVEDTNE